MRADIDARAGRYFGQCGGTKKLAAAVDRSPRRIRQIKTGEAPGMPQKTLDWIDAMIDAGLNPWPVVAMIGDRITERMAETQPDCMQRWVEACEHETRKQSQVDLIQLALRAHRAPELLEAFADEAGEEAAALLTMAGAARVEARRLRKVS